MPATKIATCCYCGTRAALVLRGDIRHELSCAACGAPLHDLKAMPVDRATRPKSAPRHPAPSPRPPKQRRRKRKSLSRRILSEALDLIEDILD